MKFKTKEDIKNAEKDSIAPSLLSERNWCNGFNEGVDKAFQSFAERIELHQKYKNKPTTISGAELLEKEHPEIWNIFTKYCVIRNENQNHKPEKIHATWTVSFLPAGFYNDWLFDYCFGDVIK